MRILHVITGLVSGGAEAMLMKLVSHMDRARFDSVVVSLTDEGVVGNSIHAAGIDLHSLGMRRATPDPRGLFRLRREIKRTRPDLIQSWLYHADVLATLASLGTGVPVMWNIRSSDMQMRDYGFSSRLALHAGARLSRFPIGVIVNSIAGKDYHERLGYRPRAWHVVPNGFDIDRFKPHAEARRAVRAGLGIPPAAPLVGMFARFDPMKDHATFFRAAARIHAERPDVRFLVAGEGTEAARETSVLTGNESLQSVVHVLGYRDDVSRLLAATDVVALSSAYGEGFPNIIGEAMAAGVPCVATRVGDCESIIGETGVVVAPGDDHAFAAAVSGLLRLSDEERGRLGVAARRRVAEHFSLPAIVRLYESIYARALPE